jgi:SM-20-related protein
MRPSSKRSASLVLGAGCCYGSARLEQGEKAMATAAARVHAAPETWNDTTLFDFAAFEAAPLAHDPFDYLIVPGFLRAEALRALNRDFPQIEGPSNFPPERLTYGPAFAALIEALRGRAFAARIEGKFEVDLSDCVATIGIRKFCEATDGNIHTDHKSKLITVLLYFNEDWPHAGGRLRMVRSASDLEDYAAEVVPAGGTLLVFRRTDNSFHGHKPFVGERRMLQLSYTRGGDTARFISHLTKPVRRLLGKS